MPQTEIQVQNWSKNRRLTLKLLVIWFVATFVVGWYASELNELTFLGPLGFYMSAQGSLLIYLAIIWYYARYMNTLDAQHASENEALK